MSKLPPLSRLKLIGCVCASSHCPLRKSAPISQGCGSEGPTAHELTLLLYREGRKGEMLDCMAWTLSEREKQKLTVADVELNPIGFLIDLYLNNPSPVQTTFPGSERGLIT